MHISWNRRGAELGVAAAILAVTLATWVAAGVFRPSGLLHSFSREATVGRATRHVAIPAPPQFQRDPRDAVSGAVDAGILEALGAPTDRPARVAASRPFAEPVVAPLPLGEATIDPAAGSVRTSTPATPVSAPVEVVLDAGPVLAPVTDTVAGLADTVGGVVGGLLGGRG